MRSAASGDSSNLDRRTHAALRLLASLGPPVGAWLVLTALQLFLGAGANLPNLAPVEAQAAPPERLGIGCALWWCLGAITCLFARRGWPLLLLLFLGCSAALPGRQQETLGTLAPCESYDPWVYRPACTYSGPLMFHWGYLAAALLGGVFQTGLFRARGIFVWPWRSH